MDWETSLSAANDFVRWARHLFHTQVCPTIAQLLAHWHGDLSAAVRLAPLGTAPPPAPPQVP